MLHHRRLVCALLGIIIGAPTLRLQGDYLALVTLGFGEVITQFFRNGNDIAGHNVANGDPGISPIDPIGTGPASAPGVARSCWPSRRCNVYKFLVLGLLVGVRASSSRCGIREGRLGRAWLAIREDELAASMMGVPLVRTKLLGLRGRRVLRRHRRRRQRRPRSAGASRRPASTSASRSSCC